MSHRIFFFFIFIGLLGAVGILGAFNPRAIPRMTNAYYALIHMKTRLAEDDYDKVFIRIAGGVLIAFALYVLVAKWSQLWK